MAGTWTRAIAKASEAVVLPGTPRAPSSPRWPVSRHSWPWLSPWTASALPSERQRANTRLYIGLMSGTSLDGVDGVVLTAERMAVPGPRLRPSCPNCATTCWPLNTPGQRAAPRALANASEISRSYADVVRQLRKAQTPGRGPRRAWPDRTAPPRSWATRCSCSMARCSQSCAGSTWSATCAAAMSPLAAGAPLVPAFHPRSLRAGWRRRRRAQPRRHQQPEPAACRRAHPGFRHGAGQLPAGRLDPAAPRRAL